MSHTTPAERYWNYALACALVASAATWFVFTRTTYGLQPTDPAPAAGAARDPGPAK